MNKISLRQLIILYGIYSFSTKFLTLPALLSQTAGRDAWLSALLGMSIELLLVFLTLLFITHKPAPTSSNPLSQPAPTSSNPLSPKGVARPRRGGSAPRVCASAKNQLLICGFSTKCKRAVVCLARLALFTLFALEIYLIATQTFTVLGDNLFDKISPTFFLLPLALLAVFFCIMPTRAIARSAEIFCALILLGFAVALVPIFPRLTPSAALPALEYGIIPPLRALAANSMYFTGFLFLLVFRGQIAPAPHFGKKFMGFATLFALFFVAFVFLFTAHFGPLAPYKTLAITSLNLTFEWFVIATWLLLLLLRLGLTAHCAWLSLRPLIKSISSPAPQNNSSQNLPPLLKGVALAPGVFLWRKKSVVAFALLLLVFLPQSLARPPHMSQKTLITEMTLSRTADTYQIEAKIAPNQTRTATGTSLMSAYYNLAPNHQLSVSHCNKIIIGPGLETDNLAAALQYFLFRPEMNNSAKLFHSAPGQTPTTLESFYRTYLLPASCSTLTNGNSRALYVGGKFALSLTEPQTQSLDLLAGRRVKSRLVHDQSVLHIAKNTSTLKTRFKNGTPIVDIHVRLATQLESHPFATHETINALKSALTAKYRAQMLETLATTYPTADAFQLYDHFHKYHTRALSKISLADFMENIQFNVSLDISINT